MRVSETDACTQTDTYGLEKSIGNGSGGSNRYPRNGGEYRKRKPAFKPIPTNQRRVSKTAAEVQTDTLGSEESIGKSRDFRNRYPQESNQSAEECGRNSEHRVQRTGLQKSDMFF